MIKQYKSAALIVMVSGAMFGCGAGGSGGILPTSAGAGTGVAGLGRGPSPVNLGAAGSFVILAETTITNTPSSAVTGNVGLSPATGAGILLSCPEVTGTIYSADAAGPACKVTNPAGLSAAIGAKGTAYTDAAGRAPDYIELGAGNISSLNLGPATYKWSTALAIYKNVTLTGGPNDVWIFQVAQGLTVASGVQVILAGGAKAQNVFWQVFSAADFDTTSKFKGIVLSQTGIVLKTGATIDGRLLAGTAVTLDQNVVTEQ